MMLRILFSLSLFAVCVLSIRDEGDPSCRRRLFDLIFVIDGSRSVNKENFETIKTYVKDFVEEYHVDPSWTRVAVIQYGSLIKEEISLGEYNDKSTLQDAISQIQYMDAGTMTGRALKHVALNMLNPDAVGSRGGGNSRTKTKVILLTDGRSQDSRYGTVSKYQQVIKNYGADLYVVAVGRNVNETELNEIASKPVSKYLHRYDKFGSIRLKSLDIGEDVECDEDECATDTHGCVHICVNTFGSYKCDCEDGYYLNETDQRSCHGKIPPPPIHLAFDPIFVTSTNASWDVPHLDMYLQAVAYNVSYRRSNKRGGWKQVTVTSKSHHVTGLKANTEYEYKVFSITESGEVSSTTRGTFKTAEVGRTSVKLFDPTSHSLTAKWTVSGGPGITGFKLRYAKYLDNSTRDPNFKTKSRKLGPEISEHKLDQLEPNTYYDSWVLPMYGTQEGKLADHYGLKTTKLVPSVENLVVEEVTPRTAAIRWGLRGSGDKYEEVKVYIVKWWRVGATRKFTTKQTRRAEYTISNLRQGTEYMVSVAAMARSGEISDEVTGKFVTGSHGDTRLRVNRPDFTSFHTRWSVENAEHVTGYELKYFETERNGNESKVMTFGPNTSKTTVRALKPGTRYTVMLTPKIGRFDGKTVTKQISTVSLGSVEIEHIASSVSSITFRWAESRSLGLSGFEIRYIDSSTNEETSLTVDRDIHQHSLIDLQPGTAYTVMVTPLYGDDRGDTATQVLRTEDPGDVILKIGEPKVTSLKVRWNMEENDENEITEYEFTLSSDGEENIRTFLFDSTVHEKTLKKLEPETDYTVAVTPIYGSVRGNTAYETATTASRGGVDLELVELTSESITSRWVVDDTDGLQNYRLIYRVTGDDKSEIELSMDDKTSEQTLEGLTPDTSYTVEVTPIYRRYEGRTTKKTIKTRAKRMADVENLNVEKLSDTSVKLSWQFSGEGDEYQNISKSNISWKKKNTKKYNRNSTTDTSFVIEGLDPGTEYVFRVDATGTSGTKSNTLKEFFIAGGTTVTKIRTKIYIVKVTSTTITIRWIVTNTKGITGYKLIYYTIGEDPEDVQITEMDLAADVSEKTITGLESDSKVVVEVIPMYGEEEGSPASKTITTGSPEIPQPSNLQVKLTSSDTARVDWETTVTSDEHERVAYFLIKLWRPEFPGYELEEEISDPAVILQGLKEDSLYTMSVEAVTETGERSEPLIESFETNARSDVFIQVNDRTSRSLDVEWEAEDDGSLTGFELEYRKANESELEFPEIKVLDAGVRNWTIDYLEPGSSYVILLTPFYNGIAGKTATLKTRTNQYFGPRVVDVRVKVIDYTSAVAAWNVENGEDEMLYNIKVTSEYDEDMLIDEMTTNTSFTLEGLQPYLDYKLQITPWFEEGSGWSGSGSGSGDMEEPAFTETAMFNTALPSKLVGVKTTSLVAIDQTPHSLTIKWDPDIDGEITQYRLNYSTVIDGNVEEIGTLELDEDVTLAVLNNLTPDTEYEVQLIPVRGEEKGAAITLNAITDGLKIPRLDGLHVTVTSPTTANAEWNVLGTSDDYEQVEKYQLMYRAHENKGPTIQEVTKDRFFNLSHMLVDQYYTITVDGLTTDGNELNTLRIAFKTDEAEKVEIEVDEMTTSQMLVRWSLQNDEGVNRYVLSYYQADHPTDRPSEIPMHGSTHERRLYRLEPNTTYTIQVAPMFGFEMGEATIITATTPAFEPVELEEVSANQTEIQMRWFVNDEAAIHVDGFDILYYPASDKDGSQRKMVHVEGEEREATLNDLSPGVDYNVELTPIYETGSVVADGVTVKRMVTTAEGPVDTIPEGEEVRITNLKVTDVTIKSARFEWEVEGSNKSIDQVYYYFFTLSDGEAELMSHETEDNFYELDNLDPGFFYSVSVAAQTAKGLVSPVNQQFQTNELEKVEIVSVSSTSESITLEWKIADNIRPFLTEYEIVIDGVEDDAEAGSTYNVGPHDTELTVDNLQPGKAYTVLIVPIVTGWDAEETTVEVTTKKIAPSIDLVSVPQVSHTYANISWQVTSGKGYEEVSYFKVVVYNMDENEVESFDISPDERSTRLNGLKPSTAYEVRISVVSENSEGYGDKVSQVEFITLSLGRTSVELSDPSPESMYVKWTTDNTDGLTAYSMTVTSVEDGEIVEDLSRMFMPGQTAFTLTNLDPATMYQVQVTPFFGNINGTSGTGQLTTDKRMPELGNVEIDEITQQTATLSWEVLGTGPLFHEVTEAVYLLKQTGSNVEKTQTTKTTSVIFNELSPSTTYEYAVLLRTKTNETQSVMGTFETLTFGEVNITSVKSELNSIQINWDHDDSTITNYELSYYAQRETGQQLDTEELKEKKIIIQGDQKSYVFDSLQPNTMYTMAITPIHDVLTGITVSTSVQTEKLVPELQATVANEVTPYSAELSWDVQPLNGSFDEIKHYAVQYNKIVAIGSDDSMDSVEFTITDTSVKLSDLEPDTMYESSVNVVTEGGMSSPAHRVEFTTNALSEPILDLDDAQLTSITAQWKMDGDEGGLTGYLLEYFQIDEDEMEQTGSGEIIVDTGKTKLFTAIEDEFVVEDLEPNTMYQFSITPKYGEHSGLKVKRELRTKKYVPSISDISVENIEDVTAVLAWNVSGIGEDFQEIQHFTVMRWKLGDERSLFIFTESADQSDIVFENLEASTIYEVSVTLTTIDLEESKTIQTEFTTAPLRTANITSVQNTQDSISLTFDVDKKEQLSDVTIEYWDEDNAKHDELTLEKEIGLVKLEGLQPGTKYNIRLTPNYDWMRGATQELQVSTKKQLPQLVNFELSNLTQVGVHLKWDVNGTGRKFEHLRNYVVELGRPSTSFSPKSFETSERSILLEDLRPEERYIVNVYGEGEDGRRTLSTNQSFSTPSLGHTYTQVSNITGNSFMLDWETIAAEGLTHHEIVMNKYDNSSGAYTESHRSLRLAANKKRRHFGRLEAATQYLVSITPIFFGQVKGITVDTPVSTDKKMPNVHDLRFHDITHTSFNVSWDVESGPKFSEIRQFIIRVYNEGYGSAPEYYRPETFYIYSSDSNFDRKWLVVSELPPSLNLTVTLLALTDEGYTNKLSADVSTESYSNIVFNITSLEPTSMNVMWKPVGGTGLTSYKLTYYPAECLSNPSYAPSCDKIGMFESFDLETTEKNIVDLLPGEEYVVVVRPIHGQVRGAEFELRQLMPKRLPETTNFQVSSVGHKTAAFTWDVEGHGKEYEEVEEYKMSILENDEQESVHHEESMDGRKRRYEIKDLNDGTSYRVMLQGKTEDKDLLIQTAIFNTKEMGELIMDLDKVTNSSISTKWSLKGGEELTGFKLKYYPLTEEQNDEGKSDNMYWMETIELPMNSSEFTITGLKPGTLHAVSVTPVYSDQSEGVTIEEKRETEKLQPRASDLRVTHVNLTSAQLEWQMQDLSQDYDQVIHYEVLSQKMNDDGTTSDAEIEFNTVKGTSYLLEDLDPNSTYKVWVSAISSTANFSTPVTVTFNTGIIGTTEIDVKSQKHSSIRIAWTRAPGSYLSKYLLKVEKDDFKQTIVQMHEIAENEIGYLVKDLEPDMKYRIEITPIYSWLEGKPATARVSTTKVPVRVHKLRIVENGYTSAILAWNIDAPIDYLNKKEYEFKLSHFARSDPSEKRSEAFVKGVKNFTFEGLRPDTSYTVTIRALNVDEKLPIPYLTFTTKSIGYFDATSVNVSSSEIYFSWRTSSLDLDDLTEIDVTLQEYGDIEVKRHLKIMPDSNPFKIDELKPGTTYVFDFTQKIKDLFDGKFAQGNSYRMRETTSRLVPKIKAISFNDMSRTSTTATWTLEDDKGPYVDDIFFVLKLRVVETDEIVKMFQHDTQEYMLTGLWPDTTYELNITVVSQFGRAKEFSETFTTLPTDAMELNLINPTKYSLTASWEPPEGLEVQTYELHYAEAPNPSVADPTTSIPKDQFIIQRFSGSRKQFTINDLLPGTYYYAKIYPMYKSLRGAAGDDVETTTKIFPHPHRIDNYNIGLYKASVKWEMDGDSSTSANITHFVLNLTSDKQDVNSNDTSNVFITKERDFQFRNLEAFTRYQLTITPVTNDVVDEEERERFTPPQITFYTLATGQHEMTLKHKGDDLIMRWRSYNAKPLTDYRIAVYGPFEDEPDIEADNDEWKENKEAFVTMMEPEDNLYSIDDVTYFKWYVVELTPVFDDEDAPTIRKKIETVPNREKLMPTMTSEVMNVTHSTAQVMWNISIGDRYLPIKEHIWIQYQPVGDPFSAKSYYIQLPATVEHLNELDTATDYEYKIWFQTDNGTVASHGMFTTLPETTIDVTLYDANITSIKVKWEATNLDSLTGYLLQYKSAQSTVEEALESPIPQTLLFGRNETGTVLRNLEPGTHYQVRVEPLYGESRGKYEAIEIGSTEALRPPTLKVWRNTNTRMKIVWRNYKNLPVSGYVIKVFPTRMGNLTENTRVIKLPGTAEKTLVIKRLIGIAYDVAIFAEVGYDFGKKISSENNTVTAHPKTLGKPAFVKVDEHGAHTLTFQVKTFGYNVTGRCVPLKNDIVQPQEAVIISELERSKVLMACNNLTSGVQYKIVTRLHEGNKTSPAKVVKTKTNPIAPISFKLSESLMNSSTSLQAYWRAPKPSDDTEITYHLEYYPVNDVKMTKEVVIPADKRRKYTYTLSGLIPDETYVARLHAESSTGPKSHIIQLREKTLPEQINLKLESSDATFVNLSWTPTVFTDADSYEVVLTPTDEEKGTVYQVPANVTNYVLSDLSSHELYGAKIRVVYTDEPPRKSETFGLSAITTVYLENVTNTTADLVWDYVNNSASNVKFFISFKRGFENRKRYLGDITTPRYHLDGLKPNEEYALDVGVVYDKLVSAPVYTAFTTDSYNTKPSIIPMEEEDCSCSQMRNTQNRLWTKLTEQAQTIITLTRQLEEYKARLDKKKEREERTRRTHF